MNKEEKLDIRGTSQSESGKELLIHFYFTEQVPAWFKVFAFLAFSWFSVILTLGRFYGIFEKPEELTFSEKSLLAFASLVPLLMVGYVTVVFYWWLAHVLVNFSIWGKAYKWTRVFWFLVLLVGTFILIDPFDIILKNMAKFPPLSAPGIGSINPLEWLGYLVFGYLCIILCWHYLRDAFSLAWERLKEWWELAVSLPMGMKITLIHLFRKNFTFYYPEQRQAVPDYFRGRHVLDFDETGEHLCISCKACERICPDRLILISFVKDPETRKLELTGFLLDNSRCSFCGLCEDVCPTGAIRHTDEFDYSVEDRGELILDLLAEYKERSKPLREKRMREQQVIPAKKAHEIAGASTPITTLQDS